MENRGLQISNLSSAHIESAPSLLLASQSPRRHQLLKLLGWTFGLASGEVNENPRPGESPKSYVLRVAASKAQTVTHLDHMQVVVIAADTSVVYGGEIIGKPRDADEATHMLLRLRDREHEVYTGIALMQTDTGYMINDLCGTEVTMRDYTDDEIQKYVESGDFLDKAGGYAIQDTRFNPVRHLRGCYANVMGLPICHLVRNLVQWGYKPSVDVPKACQTTLDYPCPIFEEILHQEI
ncbi:MAG: Maf family protein [Chloroflexota bacterium]